MITRNAAIGLGVRLWLWIGCCLVGGLAEVRADDELAGLVLTWQRDPTTTMTIDWHRRGGDGTAEELEYRPLGAAEWRKSEAEGRDFPFTEDWRVHRTELTGLEPGTLYEFRPGARGEPYRFRTMPATLERPLRLVVGGDVAIRSVPEEMNRVVAGLEPDAILWGGDYAYSDGRKDYIWKEEMFHRSMVKDLVTTERRVFPLLAAIGNHDVMGNAAPYYLATFAWPGNPPRGVMDFGGYLSVVILDSNHLTKVDGEQTDWLRQVLEERAADAGRVILPLYHVGAYPSVRDPDDRTATEIRTHWVPHFEKAGLTAAFEFHDHAYKRTHPMRAGERMEDAADGVTYLGDGAWGASTRATVERPYLLKAERIHHVHLLEFGADGPLKFQAIDAKGQVFDEFELPRRQR